MVNVAKPIEYEKFSITDFKKTCVLNSNILKNDLCDILVKDKSMKKGNIRKINSLNRMKKF